MHLQLLCEKMAEERKQAGGAVESAGSGRLLQSLRDLVSRTSSSSLAFLPTAVDDRRAGVGQDWSRSPEAPRGRNGGARGSVGDAGMSDKSAQRVLLLVASDATEFAHDLQSRLQTWGFRCCLAARSRVVVVPTAGWPNSSIAAGHERHHEGKMSFAEEYDVADGDAEDVAARCGAAVVVMSRSLLLCPRARVLLSALTDAGVLIFSVRAEGTEVPRGWLAEACPPTHHIGASVFKDILRSLVSHRGWPPWRPRPHRREALWCRERIVSI